MLVTQEVIAQIRDLELKTKKMLAGSLIGGQKSRIKGLGLEFDQVRQYKEGDDIRAIDWKGSARTQKLLVKQYLQDQDATIMILVDVSQSLFYGSTVAKYDLAAQVAGVLALVGNHSKDKVGLMLFSDAVELYIEPARGHAHIQRCLQYIFSQSGKPAEQSARQAKKTDIAHALKQIINRRIKKGTVFIISDFIDINFESSLRQVAYYHDCIAIRVADPLEKLFAQVGFLMIADSEQHTASLVDTSTGMNRLLLQRIEQQNRMFRASGVDLIEIWPHMFIIKELIQFFSRRFDCNGT